MVQRLPIEVSASVGIAVAPEHATEAEGLLRRADAAVQAARKRGRGSERPVLAGVRAARSGAARSARRAAARARGQRAAGCTTSPRSTSRPAPSWAPRRSCAGRTRKRGFVSPAEFVPLAEQTGPDPPAHALGARPGDRRVVRLGARRPAAAGGDQRLRAQPAGRAHRGRRRGGAADARRARRPAADRGHRERRDARRRPRGGGAREPHGPRRRGLDRRLRHRLLVARAAAPAAGARAQDRQVVRDRDGRRRAPRTRRSCARRPTWPTTWA